MGHMSHIYSSTCCIDLSSQETVRAMVTGTYRLSVPSITYVMQLLLMVTQNRPQYELELLAAYLAFAVIVLPFHIGKRYC